TSFLLVAVSIIVLVDAILLTEVDFTRWTLPLLIVLGSFFFWLNISFFKFFELKRGERFALHAMAWRFGYDLYSGLGFCYGSLRFVNSSTRRILSEAFAKLDAVALGTAVGSLLGGTICATTVVLLLKGGYDVGRNLSLLAQFFPGYSVTWA